MLRTFPRLISKTFLVSKRFNSSKLTVQFSPDEFATHLIDMPSLSIETDKEELMKLFRTMQTMRRMEITCDTEYKARNIRGFCHLYDGQEAIATGMDAALTQQDAVITGYRVHALALLRGYSVEQVFAELFGYVTGATKGKGGSMHFYNKKHNFYGGSGIVGGQVPCGAGLAFALKYITKQGERPNMALAMYGDGAANQGQIWESANMAKLWKLPFALVIENNHFGMGTSTVRHSCNDKYYTMGGTTIPGIRINGMNVLACKRGMEFVKNYCTSDNGPIYVEFDTYRYHGHSMSDPGTTYRTRDEVSTVRQAKDPIENVKKLLLDNGLATAEELKQVEKEIRNDVQEALARAKTGQQPPEDHLYKWVYSDANGQDAPQSYIRMPDYHKSIRA